MEYEVTLQVSISVEADDRDEAISNAEAELDMTEFSVDRVMCAYAIEDE